MTVIGATHPRPVADEWRDRAACKGLPLDWWFPPLGRNATKAKAVCASCPVQADCLTDALAKDQLRPVDVHPTGVYGGKSPKERVAIARGRRVAS